MDLSDIYNLVADGLFKVEEELSAVTDVENRFLSDLLQYSVKNSGKRIRPVFTLLAGRLFKYNLEKLVPMAAALELLHSATLVHDDIIDNSPLRRGKPTVSHAWGANAALLLGDYLFAKAGRLVASTGNLHVIKLFAQTLMTISKGELEQINVPYEKRISLDHYLSWISDKTACLFSTSTESGAVLGGAPRKFVTALKNYGFYFGMTFQVIDDILDFTGNQEELGKPVGSDLKEGIITLPSIIFAETKEGNNIIRKAIDSENKEYAQKVIEEIKNSSAIEKSMNIAKHFSNKAMEYLSVLPESETRASLIRLIDIMLERKR